MNEYEKLHELCEDLRKMAVKNNIAFVTAKQLRPVRRHRRPEALDVILVDYVGSLK